MSAGDAPFGAGLPGTGADVATAGRRRFDRERRRAIVQGVLSRLQPSRVRRTALLPLADVLAAAGRGSVLDLGCHTIPLDAVAGTLTRTGGEFDRRFTPRAAHLRERWEAVADAAAAGEDVPPITVVAVGGLYFVVDGHHRVSVARAFDRGTIEACVQRVCTTLYACDCLTLADLPALAGSLAAARDRHHGEPDGWAGLDCTDPVLRPPRTGGRDEPS